MSRLLDTRQYRILLAAGLRLALTGSRGGGKEVGATGDDGSRHLLGASYGLTLSTVVAVLLLPSPEPIQFLLVTIGLSMIFTATAVIGELAGGLFHPLDLAVTGHLPVPAFTRFAARFTELLVFLLILTLNLNLTPAVFLFFKTGGNWAAPFAGLFAAFCASLFTAGACLLVYTLLARFLSATQFQGALLYVNVLVSLGVLGLLVNVGHLIEASAGFGTGAGGAAFLFPPAWFAGLALWIPGLPGGSSGAALAAAAALGAGLLPLLLAALGPEALLRALSGSRGRGSGRSAPGPLMRAFAALFVRPEERAAFEFTAVQLGRDRGFRIKSYPILGVPILIMTLSIFEERDPLFFVLMLHLMNLYLPLVLAFLPFGDDFRGSWIFEALPVEGPRSFSRGAEKAFIFRIALPLLVLNAVVLALVWSPLLGPLNAFFAFLAGLFVVGARFRQMRIFPFTCEFRGSVSGDMGGSLGISVAVLGLAAWIQYVALDAPGLFWGAIAVMAIFHKIRFAMVRASAAVLDRFEEARS